MIDHMDLEGIFPAMVTPFHGDGEIDEDGLIDVLDFLVDDGVHGIYLLGTTGETPLLDKEEKKRVIDLVSDHVDDTPIIAGSMAASTKEAVELGKHCEGKDIDAIHAVVPYYFPMKREGILNHYRTIAEKVDLPIFIYSFPQRTGNDLDMRTLKELSKINDLVGIKDSSGDLEWIYRMKKEFDEFTIFGGADSLILPFLQLGLDGAVTAIGNVFPNLVVELYEEYKAGREENAREIQDGILEIKEVFSGYPYLSAVKEGLNLRGVDVGGLRGPMVTLDEKRSKDLKKELNDIDILQEI